MRTGIALAVCTSVIQLASRISVGNIDFGEVSDTSDLHVFGSLDEMDALQSAVRDGARATTGLGAISDSLRFNVTDGGEIC